MSKIEQVKYIIPYWNHIWQSRFLFLVMSNTLWIPKELYWAEF